MNPGDLFDWAYKYNNERVRENEQLWSSTMNQWVPIGGPEPMLCIGITDEMIVWLSASGLFHARVDDTSSRRFMANPQEVVPRARG